MVIAGLYPGTLWSSNNYTANRMNIRFPKGHEEQESQEGLKRKKAEEAKAAARQKNEEELKRAYFD